MRKHRIPGKLSASFYSQIPENRKYLIPDAVKSLLIVIIKTKGEVCLPGLFLFFLYRGTGSGYLSFVSLARTKNIPLKLTAAVMYTAASFFTIHAA